MKKDKHPPYRDVVFIDTSTGTEMIVGSALETNETVERNGKTYPVRHITISSASHPLFTGSQRFIDTEGRVDKFRKRYAKPAQLPPPAPPAPKAAAGKTTAKKKK